jgi:hypothetical protein
MELNSRRTDNKIESAPSLAICGRKLMEQKHKRLLLLVHPLFSTAKSLIFPLILRMDLLVLPAGFIVGPLSCANRRGKLTRVFSKSTEMITKSSKSKVARQRPFIHIPAQQKDQESFCNFTPNGRQQRLCSSMASMSYHHTLHIGVMSWL